MIEFFQSIFNYISVIVDFVVSFFTNLLNVMSYVPRSLVALGQCFGLLPAFITVPLFAVISISLIINILNLWG